MSLGLPQRRDHRVWLCLRLLTGRLDIEPLLGLVFGLQGSLGFRDLRLAHSGWIQTLARWRLLCVLVGIETVVVGNKDLSSCKVLPLSREDLRHGETKQHKIEQALLSRLQVI